MPLRTTCIGAYPKPDYVPVLDWFQVGHDATDYTDRVMRRYEQALADEERATEPLDRATVEAVRDQVECGIDAPTDGEQRRENYIHYHCRHLSGFDFQNLTRRVLRGGAYQSDLPTIRGPISPETVGFLVRDWQVAQAATDRPVKMTIPGPLTIADTTADAHYDDPRRLSADLADALKAEARALAEAGCRAIQIDEPIFARKPQAALAYGIEALERCFHGVGAPVARVMHMCCGYPNHLDDADYPKADPGAYLDIAKALDGRVDEISIEDSHRHNPPELFDAFERSSLIVGFVRIASSRLESVEEIAARMRAVLERIPAERLIAAPDCGLGFLGRDLAMAKLRNLCAAARSV